jgi:hypothetical protein
VFGCSWVKYGVISIIGLGSYDEICSIIVSLTPMGGGISASWPQFPYHGERKDSVGRLKNCDPTIQTVDVLILPRVDSICNPVLLRLSPLSV